MGKLRLRHRRRTARCRLLMLSICIGLAAGACLAMKMTGNDPGLDEQAVSGRSWHAVKPVLEQRIGTDYHEAGMCTGYLYWCLDHAYGTDWGVNSVVADLENRLAAAGITKVREGRSGKLTDDMKPGDIVIFAEGKERTHCAILGEAGALYHACSTSGVVCGPTLEDWMALPYAYRNCERYIVYRGLDSTSRCL